MIIHPESARPVIYLSGGHTAGTDEEEKAWLKRTRCKYRCYSVAYTCPDMCYYSARMRQSLDVSLKNGVGVFMDSGAHSFHKFAGAHGGKISAKKKKSIATVEELREQWIVDYIAYLEKYDKLYDFSVTFDYIKDCPTIYKVTQRFRKAGFKDIVPVFHGDQSTDWLQRYYDDGHRLIGISTIGSRSYKEKRYYYDQVFEWAAKQKKEVMFHGFAVTALSLMYQYPWYSVDSATWVKVAAYGKIICIDPTRNIINQVHVSKDKTTFVSSYNVMPKSVRKVIKDQVESNGFDFEQMRTDLRLRGAYNAFAFNNLIPRLKGVTSETAIRWKNII